MGEMKESKISELLKLKINNIKTDKNTFIGAYKNVGLKCVKIGFVLNILFKKVHR